MENILLIVPKFFKCEESIYDAISKKGNKVTLIYENIEMVNHFYRTVHKFFPGCRDKVFYDYYKRNLKKTSEKYDRVIIIHGGNINKQIMELIKRYCTDECKYIMYQWDNVKTNNGFLKYIHYFDKIYTFDMLDAKEYGWTYRPLFFIDDLVKEKKKEVDIAYFCSLHSKRAELYNIIVDLAKKKNFSLFVNVYSQFVIYFKHKYLDKRPEYQAIRDKDVSFNSLQISEAYDLYNKSKIVLDFSSPYQNGYTMRTIESLGAKCKLVTNNKLIKEADFYNPNNILIYEDDFSDFDLPDSFFNTPYEDIPESIYRYYSIDTWAETLLS